MNNILLHACCAPCSVMCVETLRGENVEPAVFWYSPNIHPYTEYKSRLDALKAFSEIAGFELIVNDYYGLREFVSGVSSDLSDRCGFCYALRLDKAAEYAAENNFSGFTTSLLISPYQNHELIKAVGEKAAQRYGVEFVYRDFRPLFREGQKTAREMGLYMQKYCGCIFSEEERYLKIKA